MKSPEEMSRADGASLATSFKLLIPPTAKHFQGKGVGTSALGSSRLHDRSLSLSLQFQDRGPCYLPARGSYWREDKSFEPVRQENEGVLTAVISVDANVSYWIVSVILTL